MATMYEVIDTATNIIKGRHFSKHNARDAAALLNRTDKESGQFIVRTDEDLTQPNESKDKDKLDLDSMIMDIEVNRLVEDEEDKIRIKFVAITGGCGPELLLPEAMAEKLKDKLVTLFSL